MARRFAPLVRERKLAALAESLGIDVDEVHRALPDATTCARIFCALFPKLCANAASLADALRLLGPRRRPTSKAPPKIPREKRPDLSKLPDDRYPSMDAVVAELAPYAAAPDEPELPPSRGIGEVPPALSNQPTVVAPDFSRGAPRAR